ncbi:MAG: inner membrane CreD family protein [Bacteroidales bacterium]|nr:inner membrane CreD family protein [Bacteroidales bacterium]
MEIPDEMYDSRPRFTITRVGNKTLFILGVSLVLAFIARGIGMFALDRKDSGLISDRCFHLISDSSTYCFAIIAITSLSLVLVEIAFRKQINYLQYALIGCALCLFYLLLLSMAEFIAFSLAYVIVAAMTIGLIALFVKGITNLVKAVCLITVILAIEYALMLLLITLGQMALLVGSLLLFALIALSMYFTIKLKLVDEELTLK